MSEKNNGRISWDRIVSFASLLLAVTAFGLGVLNPMGVESRLSRLEERSHLHDKMAEAYAIESGKSRSDIACLSRRADALRAGTVAPDCRSDRSLEPR